MLLIFPLFKFEFKRTLIGSQKRAGYKLKMRILHLLVLAIIKLTLSSAQEAPTRSGVNVALKQEVLDGYKDFLVQQMLNLVGNVQIPDIRFNKDWYLIGIDANMTNAALNNFKFESGKTQLKFLDEEPSIELAFMGMEFSFEADFGFISSPNFYFDYGKITFKILPFDFVTRFTPMELDGQPQLDIDYVDLVLTHFNLTMTGKSGLVEGLGGIVDQYEEMSMETINGYLQKLVKSYMAPTINGMLYELPMQMHIPSTTHYFDYSLTKQPQIDSTHCTIFTKGTAFRKEGITNYPFPNDYDLPNYDVEGLPLQTFISEYTLNTILYNVQATGFLSMNFTGLPGADGSTTTITAKDVKRIVPDLSKVYGDDAKIRILIESELTPTTP